MNKIDFAIKMLKELSLCSKHQNAIKSIEDGNVILGIICDEVEKMEVIKCPHKVENVFPYGNVLVPDVKGLKEMIK